MNIIFRKPLTITWLSALTIFCFVFICATDTTPWMYEAFSRSRTIINMTSALVLAFWGLLYYRYEQFFFEKELQDSQQRLEKKNEELGEANTTKEKLFSVIADEGDGIDTALRNHLFSAAHIISKRGTLNEKGTGLGLKLCKEFVEKNNGRIWVEENKPKGTIFFVSFPATI